MCIRCINADNLTNYHFTAPQLISNWNDDGQWNSGGTSCHISRQSNVFDNSSAHVSVQHDQLQIAYVCKNCTPEHSSTIFELHTMSVMSQQNGRHVIIILETYSVALKMTVALQKCETQHFIEANLSQMDSSYLNLAVQITNKSSSLSLTSILAEMNLIPNEDTYSKTSERFATHTTSHYNFRDTTNPSLILSVMWLTDRPGWSTGVGLIPAAHYFDYSVCVCVCFSIASLLKVQILCETCCRRLKRSQS